MSLIRTKTLFERAEAVTTASQERFIEFQKEMSRQRVLFIPFALFHHGVPTAHDKDVEDILSLMSVVLQAAR